MGWLMAEFPEASALVTAIGELRERGFERLRAYSPYPSAEVERALGYGESRLPRLVFVGGLLGAAGAYLLQWWINVHAYPLNVGGRPAHSPWAFFVISFEMGILVAALVAVALVLVVGRLLQLWRPVFQCDTFRSVTRDRYWLRLPSGSADREVKELLRRIGATHVERVSSEAGNTSVKRGEL